MAARREHAGQLMITIDGPAGTGKSTVARLLARRLGLEVLDTGAMYRATALLALEQAIEPDNGPALAQAVLHSDLHFDWHDDPPRIMLGRRDVSRRIRELDVARVVSIVAAQPEVRRELVREQRRLARQHPRLVSEGRDQGSVVFPDAAVRFYVDAEPMVRAARRAAQLSAAGERVPQDRAMQEIEQRDRIDASRAEGPLVRPPDAIEIDTTHRSVEEVVDAMEQMVRRRLDASELVR